MKLMRTFCFILAIVDRRKVDTCKCGVQLGSCKACIFIMICAMGILLILFLFFVGFFVFCNNVHFAYCNNELLVKEKKTHFVNWNSVHFEWQKLMYK